MQIIEYTNLIDKELEKCIPVHDDLTCKLYESINYSIMAPGKRIRPILSILFCELCGGDLKDILPFACAIEMIHTYSLIHDDLPCMDNDDLRRGKPANHIVYGESMAMLAGDNLINLAFETVFRSYGFWKKDSKNILTASRILSEKCREMVEGQVIDLTHEGKQTDIDTLKKMDYGKTCALISAACEIGCVMADASEEDINNAKKFAINLGMAFQINDDILDVTSNESVLGKPIGSDKSKNKSNYVSILGLEKSKKLVKEYTNSALEILDKFKGNKDQLRKLTLMLSSRTN